MSQRDPRAHGSGAIYIKAGAYYGRWYTADGGRANRKLGKVRRPGTRDGLTRAQAEERLRRLMEEVKHVSNPERTVVDAGVALLDHLEALGRSTSHRETVESHLRVHIYPALGRIPIDRLDDERITGFVVRLRRAGKAPKTIRNILSTLHSVCDLAVRRRWCTTNPCRFLDAPQAVESADIRYLTQPELERVLHHGVAEGEWASLERALY